MQETPVRYLGSPNHLSVAIAKSLQSRPTLCDPIDGSPPGSPVPGILQARTLQWVAISFSNAGKWKVKVKSLSRVQLFETPRTAVYQAPQSMGFFRQKYWSGVPLPSPFQAIFKCKCIWIIKVICFYFSFIHFNSFNTFNTKCQTLLCFYQKEQRTSNLRYLIYMCINITKKIY